MLQTLLLSNRCFVRLYAKQVDSRLLCTRCYVTAGSSASVLRVYFRFLQHTCSSGMSGGEWVIWSLRYLMALPILTDRGRHCVKKLQNTVSQQHEKQNDQMTMYLYIITERILARWLVESYGLWEYRPWKWHNMSQSACCFVFGLHSYRP